jgi:hypothetical protein
VSRSCTPGALAVVAPIARTSARTASSTARQDNAFPLQIVLENCGCERVPVWWAAMRRASLLLGLLLPR